MAGTGDEKLLISQDMDLRTCYFLQEQGFLSTLPLASLDKKLYQLSRRNVLTSGAASCYPLSATPSVMTTGFYLVSTSTTTALSLRISLIPGSTKCQRGDPGLLRCRENLYHAAFATRMRRKNIKVFIIAPLKGHEFYRACKNIGGEFIQISPASRNCINIMEIRKTDNSVNELLDGPSMDNSALAGKIQKLHIFFSLLIPDMTHEERQLLDEALIKTYAKRGSPTKRVPDRSGSSGPV